MAKNSASKKSSPRKAKPAAAPPPAAPATWQRRLGQEMTALLLLGLAGFFWLGLASHSLSDPQGFLATLNAAGVHNAGGKAGALGRLVPRGPGTGGLLAAGLTAGPGLAVAPPGPGRPVLAPGGRGPGPAPGLGRTAGPGLALCLLE